MCLGETETNHGWKIGIRVVLIHYLTCRKVEFSGNRTWTRPWDCFTSKCFLTSEHGCLESQCILSGKGSWELGDMKFAGSYYQLYISAVVQNESSYRQSNLSLVLKFDRLVDQAGSKNLLLVGRKANLRSQTRYCLGLLKVTRI